MSTWHGQESDSLISSLLSGQRTRLSHHSCPVVLAKGNDDPINLNLFVTAGSGGDPHPLGTCTRAERPKGRFDRLHPISCASMGVQRFFLASSARAAWTAGTTDTNTRRASAGGYGFPVVAKCISQSRVSSGVPSRANQASGSSDGPSGNSAIHCGLSPTANRV
jgi:hypothetical protein